jgi:hypothetical protein
MVIKNKHPEITPLFTQTEIDAIETAVGLNTNGTLNAYTGTNYINAATSFKNADILLDTQVKATNDALSLINTTLDGVTVINGILYGRDTVRNK